MTTVALLRAREDAARSAALLRSRGFGVALAPATLIRATGAAPPAEPFDAVAATSAKAIAMLAPAAREAIAGLPLYVVGARAAEAAAEAGFALAHPPAPDVGALSAALRASLAPQARVLYLAGRDRKPALAAALREIGARTTVLEVYAAEAREAWSPDEARGLAGCDAALHYSRRSASLAVGLAERAGLAERFRAMAHACLSQDVAEPLRAAGWPRLTCADGANEARLVAALERALGG
jgi:uroporphyrinogen-III synthase